MTKETPRPFQSWLLFGRSSCLKTKKTKPPYTKKNTMMDELITPENLSKELLKSVLDAALLDTSYDSEGDLKVKDRVNCFVFPNQERKDRVQLLALFGFKPETTELQRLQCANRSTPSTSSCGPWWQEQHPAVHVGSSDCGWNHSKSLCPGGKTLLLHSA
jgi:hypothetical protein